MPTLASLGVILAILALVTFTSLRASRGEQPEDAAHVVEPVDRSS